MEQKKMIICHYVMVFMIAALTTDVISAVDFSAQLDEDLRGRMRESLQNDYGVNLDNSYNRAITDAWDKAQAKFRCCGVEDQSWSVYRASEWYKQQPGVEEYGRPMVPPSCCVKNEANEVVDIEKCQLFQLGPPAQRAGEINEAIHYIGCYETFNYFMEDYAKFLAALKMDTE